MPHTAAAATYADATELAEVPTQAALREHIIQIFKNDTTWDFGFEASKARNKHSTHAKKNIHTNSHGIEAAEALVSNIMEEMGAAYEALFPGEHVQLDGTAEKRTGLRKKYIVPLFRKLSCGLFSQAPQPCHDLSTALNHAQKAVNMLETLPERMETALKNIGVKKRDCATFIKVQLRHAEILEAHATAGTEYLAALKDQNNTHVIEPNIRKAQYIGFQDLNTTIGETVRSVRLKSAMRQKSISAYETATVTLSQLNTSKVSILSDKASALQQELQRFINSSANNSAAQKASKGLRGKTLAQSDTRKLITEISNIAQEFYAPFCAINKATKDFLDPPALPKGREAVKILSAFKIA